MPKPLCGTELPQDKVGCFLYRTNKTRRFWVGTSPPPSNAQNREGGFTLEGFHTVKRKNFLYIDSPILDTMYSWTFYHKADDQKGKLSKHLLNVHYVPGTTVISAMFTWLKIDPCLRKAQAGKTEMFTELWQRSKAAEWRRVRTPGHSLDNWVWNIIIYYLSLWHRCFISAYLQADYQHLVSTHRVILDDPNPSGIWVFLSICCFLCHSWPICPRLWLRPSWSLRPPNLGSLFPAKEVTLTSYAQEGSVHRPVLPNISTLKESLSSFQDLSLPSQRRKYGPLFPR